MIGLVHRLLSNPAIFELQQTLCNNYRAIRDTFPEYLDVEGKDILDVGCSTGTCAKAIISMKDNRYVGVDIDSRYVERAKKLHPHGTFMTMDARELSFPDASFDVVLFIGALHHMDDEIINACFKQLRRVVRPTGVVICAEPTFSNNALSTWLLRRDRGEHIRDHAGYSALFNGWTAVAQRDLRLAVHRFAGFALSPVAAAQRKAA